MSSRGGSAGDETTDADDQNAEELALALARKNVLARMFSQTSASLNIGHYEVVRKLGEGGMGEVYLCRDEQLGRDVAVKLVHPRRAGAPAETRLLREARGLARLSHPNVVQIYEVGEHAGGLFLAMEFIRGRTLRAHLKDNQKLDWRARLELILQAGRGLAAAHQSGLIHRDIKPDNVLVGDDGRVRVLDFGLARGLDGVDALNAATQDGPLEGEPLLDTLTAAGSLLGTPAYMAPEQHEGLACDVLSDQFSFCVVAYEALYGARPFGGNTFGELREAVVQGRLGDAAASSSAVPRKVRAAIVRGLAVAPADRWPDMDSLLSVLGDALGARRRRLMAVGAIGLLGLGVLGSALLLDPAPAPTEKPCQIGLEALDGTWDDSKRARLREGHAAAGLPDAEAGVAVIERSLDEWAREWVDVQTQVCEATHVTGVQSQDMLDRRGACLSRVLREASAVIEVLSHPDAHTIARSWELLAALPDARVCSRDDIAELHESLPADPQVRASIEDAYADVAAAGALAAAGRLDEADARIEQLRRRPEINTYAPLQVELTALSGHALLWRRDYDAGLSKLLDAARAAEGLRLDDRVASLRTQAAEWAAETWDPEREQWLVDEAEAALTRLGHPDDVRHVILMLARADLLTDAGDHEGALAARRAAIEQAGKLGAEDLAESARRLVGQSLGSLARFDEARVELETARAAVERRWGARAELLGECEFDLGALEVQAGRFEQATAHFARARQIYADLFGEGSTEVAHVDNSRATLAMLGGDLDTAEQLLDGVVAVREREPDRWPESLADTHELRGAVRFYRGDYRGAIQAYERALELRRAVFGEQHPLVGNLHANIGEARVALGEHGAARAAFALALASLEQALPADHPSLALPYKGRGQSSLALGDHERARADLERALALQANSPGEPLEHADIEFSLARALAALGEVARARDLATQARDRYRALDDAERVRAIDIWLEDQPRHD